MVTDFCNPFVEPLPDLEVMNAIITFTCPLQSSIFVVLNIIHHYINLFKLTSCILLQFSPAKVVCLTRTPETVCINSSDTMSWDAKIGTKVDLRALKVISYITF